MAFYGYQDPNIDPLTNKPRVPLMGPFDMPPKATPGLPLGMMGGMPQVPTLGPPPMPAVAPETPPPAPTPIDTMPPPPILSAVDNPPPDLRPTNVRNVTAPSLVSPSIPDVPQTSQPYRDALAYELSNPPKPKLWQRLAAGAIGGLAGAVNASGRTRIDPRVTERATRGILMGGYDDRVARAGSLAQLERQREQDAEDARYKDAQITQMGETSRLREATQSLTEAERQRVEHQRQVSIAAGLRQSKGRPLAAGESVPAGFYKHPEPVLGQTWIVPTPEHAAKLLKDATTIDAIAQLPAYLKDVEAATEALDPKQRDRVRNVLTNAITAHARAGNLKGMASVIDKWAASRNVTERMTDPVRVATEIAKAVTIAGSAAEARVRGAAEGLGGQDAIDTWSARIERGEAVITEAPKELRGKILSNIEGRILNPKQRAAIGELNKARNILTEIFDVAKRVNTSYGLAAKMKGFTQNVEAWAQSNPDAQMLKTMTGGLASNFARSIGGERGVLTDRDREYAMSLLPVLGDSADITERKKKMLESFLDGASSSVLGATGKSASEMSDPAAGAPAVPKKGGTFNGKKIISVEEVK